MYIMILILPPPRRLPDFDPIMGIVSCRELVTLGSGVVMVWGCEVVVGKFSAELWVAVLVFTTGPCLARHSANGRRLKFIR